MPAINSIEAHLGFWLRFVSNHVSGRFAKALEDRELSVAEWVALRTLYGAGEGSHVDLIQVLGMTKGATSKVVTKLEQKRLVERRLAKDSAKEQLLILTSQARKLVPDLVALADENEKHFFGHLSKSEKSQLMQSMKALVDRHQLKQVPIK